MKNCAKCGHASNDDAVFCPECGESFPPVGAPGSNQNGYQQQNPYGMPPYGARPFDPYDHTAEFYQRDISANKVIAMIAYLLGIPGIIIALLASHDSPYAAFQVRQAIKLEVTGMLVSIAGVLLCWTFIALPAAAIIHIILLVVRIISFFQIASGKVVEPYIVRSLPFLR